MNIPKNMDLMRRVAASTMLAVSMTVLAACSSDAAPTDTVAPTLTSNATAAMTTATLLPTTVPTTEAAPATETPTPEAPPSETPATSEPSPTPDGRATARPEPRATQTPATTLTAERSDQVDPFDVIGSHAPNVMTTEELRCIEENKGVTNPETPAEIGKLLDCVTDANLNGILLIGPLLEETQLSDKSISCLEMSPSADFLRTAFAQAQDEEDQFGAVFMVTIGAMLSTAECLTGEEWDRLPTEYTDQDEIKCILGETGGSRPLFEALLDENYEKLIEIDKAMSKCILPDSEPSQEDRRVRETRPENPRKEEPDEPGDTPDPATV